MRFYSQTPQAASIPECLKVSAKTSCVLAGALALVFGASVPADAAGLWPLSYTQRHDANGKTYPGAKAYFYDASTGDPITVYREYSLATPHTNPVEADGNGVFPGVFIGEEDFYRFRVTTSAGAVISDDATIPNIGPSDGEGGEPPEPVEVSALAKTGDIKARYGAGTHVGWLPCNGLTMGSASSGANFADGDNEALFVFLWQNDASLAVVGGRGATAASDWAASKRLTLPDMRGRVLAGLDTMGNAAAGTLPGLDGIGEALGDDAAVLLATEIPQMALSSGLAATAGGHTHSFIRNSNNGAVLNHIHAAAGDGVSGSSTVTVSSEGTHTHTVTGTVGTASPSPVSRVQPVRGLTFYIKL
jgi:hypothetical protein